MTIEISRRTLLKIGAIGLLGTTLQGQSCNLGGDPVASTETPKAPAPKPAESNPTAVAAMTKVAEREADDKFNAAVDRAVSTRMAVAKPPEAVKPTGAVTVVPAEGTKTPDAGKELAGFLAEFRNKILTMDETAPAWDKGGEQEGGLPYPDKQETRGVARTELRIMTGARDYEMVTGGRYEFLGSAVEGLGTRATVEHHEGKESVTDPVSGQVLFYRDGNRLVIPGGTDTYLRGNILFVLGDNEDNRAVYFVADTASNFRQKRMSGKHNGKSDTLSAETRDVMAAMGRVYAKSMGEGNNCKGNGCQDGVGVYVIRAGDKKTGADAKILAGIVLGKGKDGKQEIEGIKLKQQV